MICIVESYLMCADSDNLMLMASMMGNKFGGFGGFAGGMMNNPLMMMQLMRNGGMIKCGFIPSLFFFCRT